MSMKEYTDIPASVRMEVLERDSWEGCPCCVVCGKPLQRGAHIHHFISRGAGGRGIPQNCITLCRGCHKYWHDTHDPEMRNFFEDYLKDKYDNWNEEDLTV